MHLDHRGLVGRTIIVDRIIDRIVETLRRLRVDVNFEGTDFLLPLCIVVSRLLVRLRAVHFLQVRHVLSMLNVSFSLRLELAS